MPRRKSNSIQLRPTALSETIKVRVRFSEVDSLKIVWHGHYLKYFEDGREAFGRKYGISYHEIYSADLLTPLVSVSCSFIKPALFGEVIDIETRYLDSDAAKICLQYTAYHSVTGDILAKGESVQVFLDANKELILNLPDFFIDWKKKWGLIPQ